MRQERAFAADAHASIITVCAAASVGQLVESRVTSLSDPEIGTSIVPANFREGVSRQALEQIQSVAARVEQ